MLFLRSGVLFVGIFLLFPLPVFAAVSISEIMYDVPGTDTKHEWIELVNTGSAVDISNWKLFEGNTNHKLTLVTGNSTLQSDAYAILADNPATFAADHPSFSGTLFDTTFTSGLSNSGEVLTLKDSSMTDQATATYHSSFGASGDGNSLQYADGTWKPLSPTPGISESGAVKIVPPDPEKPAVVTHKAQPQKTTVKEAHVSAPAPQSETRTQTASASFAPKASPLEWLVVAGSVLLIAGAAIFFRKKRAENPS